MGPVSFFVAVVQGEDSRGVWFDKIDYVPATGSYTILIKTDQGEMKTIYRPSDLADHFSVPIAEFFAGQSNTIQIEADAACGHTGYSNAVAFAYTDSPSPPSCLTAVGVSRRAFTETGSNVAVVGDGACAGGTTYNVHFQSLDDELGGIVLNQSGPVVYPEIQLASMPCDAGEGSYWTNPVNGGSEGAPSPIVYAGPSTCGGGGGPEAPGQPTSNLQFVHGDHLGSTRLVTDEEGAVIASWKYFPFGYEAESSGGDELRQKFTGHERDERVGLDYMMARSCRMALARFLAPDPYDGSARPALPQSWNRYAYVLNNPVNATDPTGYETQTEISVNNTSLGSANNGALVLASDRQEQPDNGDLTTTVETAANVASEQSTAMFWVGAIAAVGGVATAQPEVAAGGVYLMTASAVTDLGSSALKVGANGTTENIAEFLGKAAAFLSGVAAEKKLAEGVQGVMGTQGTVYAAEVAGRGIEKVTSAVVGFIVAVPRGEVDARGRVVETCGSCSIQ